jgi:hypothetical protein
MCARADGHRYDPVECLDHSLTQVVLKRYEGKAQDVNFAIADRGSSFSTPRCWS